MKKLLYVLTGFCLLAGAFTGCEKPNENGEGGGGTATEQFASIQGKVTDKETGHPLELALVELVSDGKKTMTDKNGEFGFAELLPGNYTLKVSRLGYKTVESGSIAVKAGNTVRQEIALEKEQSDLRIVNDKNEDIEELEVYWGEKVSFKILNAGSNILEWEIPRVAAEWVKGFSKESGKLSPGASEKIEVSCAGSSEDAEAVVYIMSNVGNKQFKLIYRYEFLDYTETALGLNMRMVAVQGGAFQMGATEEQGNDADDSEKPVHWVALDGFYIGKYEVTQAQWEAVMGTTIAQQRDKANSSWPLWGVGDNYPMYYVSWNEAVQFCEKLSQMTGRTYRLPTEAEWEYAARGGQHADGTKYAGSNYIGNVAWYKDNCDDKVPPVGQKQSNSLDLYDMSGNVYEWCSDWGDGDYYNYSPSFNPQGPANGSGRVCRGGGWHGNAVNCRVSCRNAPTPDGRYNDLGFRVACSAE